MCSSEVSLYVNNFYHHGKFLSVKIMFSGVWNETVEDCLPDDCPVPTIVHGSVNSTATNFINGTSLSITCDHNYKISGKMPNRYHSHCNIPSLCIDNVNVHLNDD